MCGIFKSANANYAVLVMVSFLLLSIFISNSVCVTSTPPNSTKMKVLLCHLLRRDAFRDDVHNQHSVGRKANTRRQNIVFQLEDSPSPHDQNTLSGNGHSKTQPVDFLPKQQQIEKNHSSSPKGSTNCLHF